jgi:hypothetical protein
MGCLSSNERAAWGRGRAWACGSLRTDAGASFEANAGLQEDDVGRSCGSRRSAHLRPAAWVALLAFVLGMCGMLPSNSATATSDPPMTTAMAEQHVAPGPAATRPAMLDGTDIRYAHGNNRESTSVDVAGGPGRSMVDDACSCCFGPGGVTECRAVLARADASSPIAPATQAVGEPSGASGPCASLSRSQGPRTPSLCELSLLRI